MKDYKQPQLKPVSDVEIIEAIRRYDAKQRAIHDLATALRNLTEAADAYMKYHQPKLHPEGLGLVIGLYPDILIARAALAAAKPLLEEK
jgi:hypothetical protein